MTYRNFNLEKVRHFLDGIVGARRAVPLLISRLEVELEHGSDDEKWISGFLAGSEKYGITAEALKTGSVEASGSRVVPFADGIFPTPSGKFEFVTALPGREKTGNHELTLVATHSTERINTTGREDDFKGNVTARILPADAKNLGVSDGETVSIENKHGAIEAEISVAERIGAGIINIQTQTGGSAAGTRGINLLTNGKQTTVGHGPVFNAIAVRVRRL